MNKKIAIYSVITNDYDDPRKPVLKGVDHILFTDDPDITAPGWRIVKIDKTEDQRLQRKIKILGHKELDKYDVTIYVDANIQLKSSAQRLLQQYRGGIMTGQHMKRNCVYQEGIAVKELNKADHDQVNKQIAEYYENNFPCGFGMWHTAFIIRDKSTRELCELWHKKLEEHTHRDQLALPWAVKETDTKVHQVNLSHYMTTGKHKVKEPIQVFYSTPFRSDKNIGKANNDFIELLPDNAWVCITDADAMFLNPDFGTRIERVIDKYGDEYKLIGCLTNRIGGLHQCYDGKFSENMDMSNHYEIANNGLPDTIKEGGVAGFCMIFSKETWKKVGGFKENTIKADTEFNKSVKRIGGKCGVYHGLYMMHAYRVWEKEHKKAKFSIEHLQ